MSRAQVFERFKAKYESLAGMVYLATGERETLGVIDNILQEATATRVAVAGFPDELQASIVQRCTSHEIQCINPPFAEPDLTQAIDEAQVGISRASWGIAQTGAVIEVATDDAIRAVSTLPRTHICLVRSEHLVDTLDEIAPKLRKIFQEHDRNCTVSFISGPSRTGDIEMKLTLGVHGPEASHVIVIDSSDEERLL